LLEKGRKWGRERKGAREAAVPILKGVGGVEQRRGWPGVVPRSEEVGEEHGGGGAARQSSGTVGRQRPEVGRRGRRGASMPRGRSKQGRPVADRWSQPQ
jgi:hypothetical protein